MSISNLPNAKIFIQSLRSIGYDFRSAVADIVDNSITAKASKIEIFFPISASHESELYLEIFDDGFGMTRSELIEAFKLGTKKEKRESYDLGKFGMGLKTASISQCTKLTVISKKDNKVSGFVWDLKHIIAENTWEIKELKADEIKHISKKMDGFLIKDSFTLVLWNDFDTLSREVTLSHKISDVFINKMDDLMDYFSLIYHIFIDEGLEIFFNGTKVQQIDPFLKYHPKTLSKAKRNVRATTSNNNETSISVESFVLPFKKYLTNDDYEKLGKNLINEQGIYIYRNKRLIIYGTWFNLLPKTNIVNNARLKIDIGSDLDDIWEIDVKKQRAIIPPSILKQLNSEIEFITTTSRKINIDKPETKREKNDFWDVKISGREKKSYFKINEKSQFLTSRLNGFSKEQIKIINDLFTLISYSLPLAEIHNTFALEHEINAVNDEDKKDILENANSTFLRYLTAFPNLSNRAVYDLIIKSPPFDLDFVKNYLKEKFL